MKYLVTIEEMLTKDFEIEADSQAEAERIVREKYRNEDIVLTADDFSGVSVYSKEIEMDEDHDVDDDIDP